MTPTLAQAARVYIKIGLLSFGGPAGQIALMQDEVVDRRAWIPEAAFRQGLSVAMVLPGPEAQQLATYLGWHLHGLRGGLLAGLAFILPGAALMILLAWIAATYGETQLVSALFYGIQPAVLVIVAGAVVKLGRRALRRPADWALAAGAFLALWALGLPFPLVIAAAAACGLLLKTADTSTTEAAPVKPRHLAATLGLGIALIAAVWLSIRLALGAEPYDGVATLFTSAAFVSFGGAYALLPYVADRAVETYGWLTATQMLNGLALAEATPGPLILVNTYAGFFAAGPGHSGVLTASLATFYTFAPSFMLILALAPYVTAVTGQPLLRRALAGVSTAVVGVILNLAFYLGAAALIPDGPASLELPKTALLIAFAALTLWRNPPMHILVALGALAGGALWVGDLI